MKTKLSDSTVFQDKGVVDFKFLWDELGRDCFSAHKNSRFKQK